MTGTSREVEAIVAFAASTGLPFRVTSTTGGAHAEKSRHYAAGTGGQGLAVDFAGPSPRDVPAMVALYRAFLGRADQLHELIFEAPAVDVLVRRKARVVPEVYGAAVLAAHRDHVHVSVDRGTFLEVTMPDDPTIPNLTDLKFFEPIVSADGLCTGYYMVSSTGEVHGHGPGAPYHGRSEAAPEP